MSELVRLARGLHATATTPLPFMAGVQERAFVLEASEGPVIVYNSPGIDRAAQSISALGTPSSLLINHWHEAMHGTPELDVRVLVHERDAASTRRSMRVDGTFDRRRKLGDDLEVIPSLAHTAGATFYLWDSGEHRFLFPGDSIWVQDGTWTAVVLGESNRQAFLETLAMMRDLDFDILAPWAAQTGGPALDVVSPSQKQRQIDALVARLQAGAPGPNV